MQVYQRRRHRILWLVIAVVVAVALTLAFYWREPIPETDKLPVSTPTSSDQGRP